MIRSKYKGGKSHRHIYLPCLDAKMKEKEASNVALAAIAGVSDKTIQRARSGGHIRYFLGITIYSALNNNSFQYKRRGPKSE